MRRRLRAGDDGGQVMVLTLGAVLIAVALVLVVASAAQVHLERKRLLALADVLALEAADAVPDQVYYDVDGTRIVLTDASVRDSVEDYLAAHPDQSAGLRGFAVVRADAPDALTARVHLSARVVPSATAWVLAAWSDGIPIEAAAHATSG